MKKTVICFAFLSLAFAGFSQDGPLTKGSIKLNLSYGLGSFVSVAGGKTTFAPLTGSLEYAINENTTLGPVIGYAASEDRYYYSALGLTDTYKYSSLLIGAKGNYYFNTGEKFEAYIGAMLGYDAVTLKLESSSRQQNNEYNVDNTSGIFYGIQVGGRYKFSSNLAAHAELGYGIALLNIGLTFSIPRK